MNIKNHRLLATVAVGAVMASCGPRASTSGDLEGELSLSGAFALYPSPPARDLYLVSRGVPTSPVVREFIRYVLAEGQRRNDPAGYIAIGAGKIEASLALLDAQPASDPKNDQ